MDKFFKPIIIILFVIFSTSSFSKNPKLNEIKQLIDSSNHYTYSNTLKSIKFGKEALKLALQFNNKIDIIEAHMCLSRAFYIKSDYSLSNYHGNEVLHISKTIDYAKGIGFSANNAGLIYLTQDNYKQGLVEFQKALQTSLKIDDLKGQSANYFNISLCYYELKDFVQAKNFLNKCIQLAPKHNPGVYAMALNRLGDISLFENKENEAREYYNKSIEKAGAANKWELSYAYQGLAKVSYQNKEYLDAVSYANKALKLAENLNAKWDMTQVYFILQSSYLQLNNYKDAYHFLNLYQLSNDSIYNLKKDKEINKLQLQRKEKENSELSNQIKLKQQQLRSNYLFIVLVSLIGIFSLVMFIVYYFTTKKISKLNGQLLESNKNIKEQHLQIVNQKEELEALNYSNSQLFSVIGHDLRSPIVSLVQTIDMLRNADFTVEEIGRILNVFFEKLTATATMLDNLLLWANGQKEKEIINRKDFSLSKLTSQLLSVQNFQAVEKEIVINHEPNELYRINADVNHTRIIVQNLISNAIKFTPKGGQIFINYHHESLNVCITIKDTGIGMSEEKKNKLFKATGQEISTFGTANEKGIGIGLMLVKRYADMNNVKIDVESGSSGTTFKVCFDVSLTEAEQ